MLGKRLINTGGGATPTPSCTTDTLQILGDTSCVAYYKMSDATDESGNFDGTPTSVNFNVAGKFGNSGEFNGSSSNMALPFFSFVSGVSANFTASLWFNVTDMSGNNTLIQLSGSSSTNSSFNVQLLSNGTFRIDSYGVAHAFSGLATVSTNNWYNLVLVNAGGNCTPYLNGSAGNVLAHNIGFSGSYSNLGSRYVLGSLYTPDITTGSIDQVRIFNKALSQANVTTLNNEVDCPCTTNTIDYPTTNVAYYEFDGNAEDSTTNGYNGTDYNVTWAQGRYGTVASFNNSSSYIDLGNNFGLANNSFSFSCWVKNIGTGSNSWFFAAEGSGNTNQKLHIGRDAGNGKFYIDFWGNGLYSTSQVTTSSTWQNWVVTFDSTTKLRKIYLNGSLDNSDTASSNYLGTGDINIGQLPGYNQWLSGTLDQVRIFSSALEITDVADLYDEQYCFDNFFNDDSTVATYKFNNTPFDDLGHYNGTASNITYTTGKFDKAAVFNGSSYIDTNYVLPADSTMSFSFWINSNTPVSNDYIISDRNSAGAEHRLDIGISSSAIFVIVSNGSSLAVISFNTITYGEWMNFVVVLNGTSITVYKNGISLGTQTSTVAFGTAATQPLYMGRLGNFNNFYFNGKMDQVRIFDRALDSGEALQLYNE